VYNQQVETQLQLPLNLGINPWFIYMFALIIGFYLGFYIIFKYSNAGFTQRVRYGLTAGLLSTKFVIIIASVLGIDKPLYHITIGRTLSFTITANTILFISSLTTMLLVNINTVSKYLTITEDEWNKILGD